MLDNDTQYPVPKHSVRFVAETAALDTVFLLRPLNEASEAFRDLFNGYGSLTNSSYSWHVNNPFTLRICFKYFCESPQFNRSSYKSFPPLVTQQLSVSKLLFADPTAGPTENTFEKTESPSFHPAPNLYNSNGLAEMVQSECTAAGTRLSEIREPL